MCLIMRAVRPMLESLLVFLVSGIDVMRHRVSGIDVMRHYMFVHAYFVLSVMYAARVLSVMYTALVF